MKNRKYLWIPLVILTLIIIDQVIKFQVVQNLYNFSIGVIDRVLSFTYVENIGVAFGLGNNKIVIIIINILIITLLSHFIISKKEELNVSILIGLSMVLGGGVSNVLDRIFRGHVIDYIDVNPLIKFAVFNFADMCVTIGISIIAIKILVDIIKQRKEIK